MSEWNQEIKWNNKNELMNERANEQTNERTNDWLNELMNDGIYKMKIKEWKERLAKVTKKI